MKTEFPEKKSIWPTNLHEQDDFEIEIQPDPILNNTQGDRNPINFLKNPIQNPEVSSPVAVCTK